MRHEANAAFMAAAVGRLTGKAGVALVTSGPGCSNLITGIATANSEGDPVVALGGAVKRADKAKLVHQSMDTVAMFSPVTKYAVEVNSPDAIAEVVSNAFRAAEQGRPGGAFVSLPQDIVDQPTTGAILPASTAALMGPAPESAINDVAKLIAKAKNPVILLGLMASQPANGAALHPAAGEKPYPGHRRLSGRRGGQSGTLAPASPDASASLTTRRATRCLHLADLVICPSATARCESEPSMWNSGDATLRAQLTCCPPMRSASMFPISNWSGILPPRLISPCQNRDRAQT
ncbi:thiamine pyrophosphate-binding protein [Enterobacter hormaechei]